jgi:hypothetical protein
VSDKFSVRAVILILGAVVLGGTYTICLLAFDGREVPALLSTLVVGTLALLCPSPLTKAKSAEVQPVTVENTTADPVPTEPQIPATTQTPEPHPDAPATSDL